MPKIKTGSYNLTAPSINTPGVGGSSIPDRGVRDASPQRAFEGEGINYLTQPLKDLAGTVGDLGIAFAKHDKEMLEVKSKDYSADLTNRFNQKYVDEIASKRGSEATDLFKNEVLTVQNSRESYLEQAGGNNRLRKMMALEYDSVSQKYLNDVLNHKLRQDIQYKQDVDIKVARSLQAKASRFGLMEINKVTETSREIDAKLANNPQMRELTKQALWQDYFKSNARINPELTQALYTNEKIKQNIIGEIGSAGYDAIQEVVDKGKSIKEHDDALNKVRVKDQEDKRVETLMQGAIHKVIKNELTAGYVDNLNVPTPEKRVLISYLASMGSGKKLTEDESDPVVYTSLLENVRKANRQGANVNATYTEIIGEMNKTITTKQGYALIATLGKRDTLDHPVIDGVRTSLLKMYDLSDPKRAMEYTRVSASLEKVIRDSDGNVKKIQEYMDNILMPSVRKGAITSALENFGFVKPTRLFEERPRATMPFMLEWEEEEITSILEKKNLTLNQITDENINEYLEYIRSEEYQGQVKKGR